MYCFLFNITELSLKFFFFNDTAPTDIFTLSLHDALPILRMAFVFAIRRASVSRPATQADPSNPRFRSEEHTSELQSRFDLVCRLLLEKKKIRNTVRILSFAPHFILLYT